MTQCSPCPSFKTNDDPAYLQSLAGQDWFRTKFTVLHQTIINRGSEPEETLHFFQ